VLALLGGVLGYPLGVASPVAAAGALLPAGSDIAVTVDSPAEGAALPPGPVTLAGTASVGKGVGVPNTALIYDLDVSNATRLDAGPIGGSCPGLNTRLDCEKDAALRLNQAGLQGGAVVTVGASAFAASAVNADVTPGEGRDLLTGPAADIDEDGAPDIITAVFSAFTATEIGNTGVFDQTGGFRQFEELTVSTAQANLAPGIRAALQIANAAPQPNRIVALMSGGAISDPNEVAAALAEVPANVHFFTFTMSPNARCTGTLQAIADRTGGTCAEPKRDANLGALPGVLQQLLASHLNRLTVAVDGGTPAPITDITPALPQTGPATVSYRTTVNGLAAGRHNICVTAVGTDSGGEGSVSDCRTVVLDAPPTVDPGGPYAGSQGSQIPIAGTASDPDTEGLRTQWAVAPGAGVNPDATCSFADAAALATTVSCTAPGQYALTLTADDGLAQPVTAGTTLTVTNVQPAVSAGGPYTGTAGLPVALTGTLTDPDSPGLVTTWSVTPPVTPLSPAPPGSTPPGSPTASPPTSAPESPPADPAPCSFTDPSALATVITCPTPGSYTLTLTATDGENPPVSAQAKLEIAAATVPVGSLSLAGAVAPAVGFVGGDPVTVTYTVRNDGAIPMPGVRLTTALPAALANAVPAPAVLTPGGGAACLAGAACELGTLQPGQRRTVQFAVPPTAAADARIGATLTTSGPDATAADNSASVRVLVRQPVLVVDPTAGPPGLVVRAVGRDFPAGARIRIAWSVGVSQLPGELIVDRDGTVVGQALVFNHDQQGARVLVATIVRGPRFGPVSSNSFLVSPRGLQPPFSPP
jgi:hypothetical protein